MIATSDDDLISKELRQVATDFNGGLFAKSSDDPMYVKAMQSKSRGIEILRGEIQRRKDTNTKSEDLLQQLLDYRDANGLPVKEQVILENVFGLVMGSVDR
mmetsp:Transcript_17723/g.20525  ORF Transcript_17723/g.20525 Transcript_17723/m.20525 type:complete len:101 (-) Transcript_17723:844-1146(-)